MASPPNLNLTQHIITCSRSNATHHQTCCSTDARTQKEGAKGSPHSTARPIINSIRRPAKKTTPCYRKAGSMLLTSQPDATGILLPADTQRGDPKLVLHGCAADAHCALLLLKTQATARGGGHDRQRGVHECLATPCKKPCQHSARQDFPPAQCAITVRADAKHAVLPLPLAVSSAGRQPFRHRL